MMQKSSSGTAHQSLLDGFSKVAFISSVMIGFAYFSGLVYSWVFYKYFRSSWVLGFLSPQDLIKEGLPWVTVCTGIALVAFNRFKDSDSMRRVGLVVIVVLGTAIMALSQIGYWVFDLNLEKHPLVSGGIEIALSLLFSSAVAMALKMILEGSDTKKATATALLGLGMTLLVLPAMRAVDDYNVLLRAKEPVPIVTSDSREVLGVLLGSVSGKFLVYDCSERSKLKLLDISSELNVKPGPLQCPDESAGSPAHGRGGVIVE
ncbi:hypothetical protein ACF8R4_08020 [Pseudomonas sp. FYR_2]|uniref:hypothetical protein n=1 Tax=unclassified Pseudomonas TaxID=196821 RepID=UPI00370CD129